MGKTVLRHAGKAQTVEASKAWGWAFGPLGSLARVLLLATAFALLGGASQATTRVYFDGGSPRSATQQPHLLAHFTPQGASTARVVRAAADAGLGGGGGDGGDGIDRGFVAPVPFVQIIDTTRAVPVQTTAGDTSPVFREGTSPAGRLMALPGGVVVNFKQDWTVEGIQAWALQGGHALGARLNILGNWYLVKTAAGMPSLETANVLQRSGDVLSATPNWWMETAHR